MKKENLKGTYKVLTIWPGGVTVTPVKLIEDVTDIRGVTVRAGSLAWIRREYRVNAGQLIRLDLEDFNGSLMLSCIRPEQVKILNGPLAIAMKEVLKEVR